MILETLIKNKLIHPPDFLQDNLHFLADSGSIAYGTNTPESDVDLFGFCTPRKHVIFPHLAGCIQGFGHQGEKFEQWQEQHIEWDGKEYDFRVLNIVNFFHLCMRNNPDQIDVLFVPQECVRHITSTGQLVRDNRKKFLSKAAYYRYRGYAFSQQSKVTNNRIGNRAGLRAKHGFDPKFMCHLYRLVYECEMILAEGDLDLRRHKDHIRYVKEGNVTVEEMQKWFGEKEKYLEKLYQECKLPEKADENEIKTLLIQCLENHYGSLEKAITLPTKEKDVIEQISKILSQYHGYG